ncbi:hypothetical protein CJD36_001110 [Flavipsychrobacter stenotrophus]|uniref:Outer membrane protein assembly factor BamE domain-containing protein n=1 Tax=Flavipsychrobacter stenotrophus TaxID=2077091 RepID=A0A2S7SZK0_9BACT|nr:outer membrane protein assembly factor BamE [Flavipsychrobacter stenotrophus]PQJ12380.1 hypothetical protein CJD36_001110 [Flavipsychrobacter stenotrophus]
MKQIRRIWIIIPTSTLLLMIIFFMAGGRLDGYSKQEAKLMQQLTAGMDSNQVISILGSPDSRSYHDDSTFLFEYFISNKMWSTLPFVKFDSAGKVTSACYHIKE